MQEALLLASYCKSVTMIQNLPYFTGEESLAKQIEKTENISGAADSGGHDRACVSGTACRRCADGCRHRRAGGRIGRRKNPAGGGVNDAC